VQVGGLLTAPLPWLAPRAGKSLRHWSPPAVGEQVLVLSPFGDPASGVALCGIFSDAFPVPDGVTADNVIMAFGDGALLLYDQVKHLLQGVLPGGGRVEVTAPGGFLLTGDAKLDGNLNVTKDVNVDGDVHSKKTVIGDTDVLAAGISGKGHKHAGVQSGGATTAPPQ
jgi:phage baseplate assembly protein V